MRRPCRFSAGAARSREQNEHAKGVPPNITRILPRSAGNFHSWETKGLVLQASATDWHLSKATLLKCRRVREKQDLKKAAGPQGNSPHTRWVAPGDSFSFCAEKEIAGDLQGRLDFPGNTKMPQRSKNYFLALKSSAPILTQEIGSGSSGTEVLELSLGHIWISN